MSKRTPYLFCRYAVHIEDELLTARATYEALNEIQGTFLASGPTAEARGEKSIVIMQPRIFTVANEEVVTWKIGHKPGHRTVTKYNAESREVSYSVESDSHILHTQIVAVPRLGALAVSDRVSTLFMGARPALSRTRAAFRAVEGGSFNYWFLRPGDITTIVDRLELTEFSYTVRRINPTPPGVLAKALDESMAGENVFTVRGVAKPEPGSSMTAGNGIVGAATEMASGGYGVLGFKGHTDDGHLAQIKKPPFSLDKKENLKQQEREHPLRIFIDDAEEEDALLARIVSELVGFYENDDTPDISEEPA